MQLPGVELGVGQVSFAKWVSFRLPSPVRSVPAPLTSPLLGTIVALEAVSSGEELGGVPGKVPSTRGAPG